MVDDKVLDDEIRHFPDDEHVPHDTEVPTAGTFIYDFSATLKPDEIDKIQTQHSEQGEHKHSSVSKRKSDAKKAI